MPKSEKTAEAAAKAATKAVAAKTGKLNDKPNEKPNPVLRTIKGGKAAPAKGGSAKSSPARPASGADDVPVIALNLPAAKLSPAMAAYFRKCQEKLGFVPNVLLAYAFDMPKLETFVAM